MSDSTTTRFAKALAGALGAMMLLSLLVPGRADASQPAKQHFNPCPAFSVQNVLDDPRGDWDHDGVTNAVELYNGLKPCVPDSSTFCASWPSYCISYPVVHVCGAAGWTWNWVYAYADGDYDNDGVSNYVEAWNGANPCAHPCPYPTHADLSLNPNGDWDGDRVSNAVEVWRGTDPCRAPVPHVTYAPAPATHRLPHVSYYVPKPPPPPKCPYGYPYYHPGTQLCYANPVSRYWW